MTYRLGHSEGVYWIEDERGDIVDPRRLFGASAYSSETAGLVSAAEVLLAHCERVNTAFYGTGTRKALQEAFVGQKEHMETLRIFLRAAKEAAE